ncbi:MAG: ABC transporter ATP-binding protein [Candidatus Thermoplasmatota archaeon]|nr:ABC transporter ATP-binding protein [Candidatus Thermoplasmatota archaeon]
MSLIIRDMDVSYPGGGRKVLRGFDLDITDGEIYSLIGGSGSGKTTVLNLIAGFLQPSRGRILIDGRDVTDERPHKRNIGMVFQDYALFPHMSVRSNIAFGLRTRNIPRIEVDRRVDDVLELTGLSDRSGRFPSALSGGEKQRVALSRALVYEPSLLLLDEPLSALDASLREGLRKELRKILKGSGTNALYVTHDQMEAVSISDRIGYLRDGRIHEEGAPERMYWRPNKVGTARFMGVSNILKVKGSKDGHLETSIGRIPWSGSALPFIGFRSESLRLSGNGICLKCRVREVEYRGRDLHLDLVSEGTPLKSIVSGVCPPKPGDRIDMFLDPRDIMVLEKDPS